jgi:ribosomal protein L32E
VSDAQKKRLMKVRSRINKRRPHFKQFESWRFVRVKDHWRKPQGIDNKMRFNLKGWPRSGTQLTWITSTLQLRQPGSAEPLEAGKERP